MKAIDVLECVIYLGLSGEDLDILDVPNDIDGEWWLNVVGADPRKQIAQGKYLVYFSCYDELRTSREKYVPTFTLKDHDGCPIHFYKLEN